MIIRAKKVHVIDFYQPVNIPHTIPGYDGRLYKIVQNWFATFVVKDKKGFTKTFRIKVPVGYIYDGAATDVDIKDDLSVSGDARIWGSDVYIGYSGGADDRLYFSGTSEELQWDEATQSSHKPLRLPVISE